MASWKAVVESAPHFAKQVEEHFTAHRHHTLATLRRDGSPRVSGIEVAFAAGELWLGMMPGSRKVLDLRRDPRLALHSASVDPADDTTWAGDAKLAGLAVEATDGAEGRAAQEVFGGSVDAHAFRIDLREVVVTGLGDPADHLVIALWRDGRLTCFERR